MVNIDIGIDLGTSNTVIYIKDKGIVVNQPSVVAYEAKSKKIIAVGNKAKKMLGKTPEDIEVTRPIRNGYLRLYYDGAYAQDLCEVSDCKTKDLGQTKHLRLCAKWCHGRTAACSV